MPGIDEAFLPFQQIVEKMVAFTGEIYDRDAGVRSRIYKCVIESPVELDVVRNDQGALQIGSTPPLYRVETTFLPAFHRMMVTVEIPEAEHEE
jgi:hypothetical protein